jgi:protein PhnA
VSLTLAPAQLDRAMVGAIGRAPADIRGMPTNFRLGPFVFPPVVIAKPRNTFAKPACPSNHERPAMTDAIVKDSNGTPLKDGDSVTLIKDLKVKGTSETIKRGTLVKNIRLNGNAGEIECNTKQVKGLVLKTEFLKKA